MTSRSELPGAKRDVIADARGAVANRRSDTLTSSSEERADDSSVRAGEGAATTRMIRC